MKKILGIIILSLIFIAGFSQSTLPLRADTVKIEKIGGNGELIIRNATRDSTGGILVNLGVGRTAFLKSKQLTDSSFVVGKDTITIRGTGGGLTFIKSAGSAYPLVLAPDSVRSVNIAGTWLFADTVSDRKELRLGVDPQVGWGLSIAPGTDQVFVDSTGAFSLVPQERLRDTAAALRAAIGSATISASDGIVNDAGVIKLGDAPGTSLAPLSGDRYIRGANHSIYFAGEKTNQGVANIIFDDTLAATPGEPKFRNFIKFNSLDHVTPSFHLGIASVDDGTGTSRNNSILNFGFNLGPGSTRVNPNYCAIGTSWEGAFQGLQEMHKFWVDKYDIQHRIESYTIDTAAKTVDLFHQLSSWSLKDVDGGAEPWIDFTGGQGSTGTNFRMYAGTTNQYRIQHGFSVNGGNTTASISTTGPGSTEFHMGIPEGWGMVSLPGLTSLSTYNSVSQQLLPSGDGTIIFGAPSARWQKISGLYLRATNGIFIGNYSGDELPNNLINFGPNIGFGYHSSGGVNDALRLINNTPGATLAIHNQDATGYSGIEYMDNTGAVKVFTGFNNSNGQEFRFNNIASGGYINFMAGGAVRLRINNTGGPTINGAYTLPAADGTSGQALVTDGSGGVTFATISGSLSGTGTSGQLALWNGTSSFTGNSSILWGTSNGPRISIGTTNTQGVLNLGGDKNLTSSGIQSYFASATYTNTTTAASGTASAASINYIASPTIAATNTGVTFPQIVTLSVDAPTAGTNATITSAYAFMTGINGHAKIQGNTEVDGALMTAGAQYNGVTSITSTGTLATNVYWVEVDASSGNITLTLPAASSVFTGARGITYKLARVDASGNTVTIQRAGSDTIGAAGTSFSLNTTDEVKTLQCVANNKWRVF